MARKKIILFIIIISLLIFFVFPTRFIFSDPLLSSLDSYIYQTLNKNKISSLNNANNQQECNKIGGTWNKVGMRQTELCEIYAQDSDKTCFAGFQCELGTCETSGDGLLTLGKCAKKMHLMGCTTEVHFGFSSMGLCID